MYWLHIDSQYTKTNLTPNTMDSKIIDTLLPKFLEIAKTLNVPADLISKIEEAVKSPMSELDKVKDDVEDKAEWEESDEWECCKCPKCGAEIPMGDMKPAASVSVAVVKKNPLKELMDKARM